MKAYGMVASKGGHRSSVKTGALCRLKNRGRQAHLFRYVRVDLRPDQKTGSTNRDECSGKWRKSNKSRSRWTNVNFLLRPRSWPGRKGRCIDRRACRCDGLPIGAWRHAGQPFEKSIEVTGITKAQSISDLLDRKFGVFQPQSGLVQPTFMNEL